MRELLVASCAACFLATSGCATTAVLQEGAPVTVVAARPVEPPPPPPPEPPPEPARVAVEESRIRVDEKIHFDTDSAVIDPVSDDLLREIAEVINSHQQIRLIRVEGHTDRVGSPRWNRILSRRRADSVVERLVENGVQAGRLVAEGFGRVRPIADNATEAGRAQNRRVEFNIIEPGSPSPAPQEAVQ